MTNIPENGPGDFFNRETHGTHGKIPEPGKFSVCFRIVSYSFSCVSRLKAGLSVIFQTRSQSHKDTK
ncbi:Uncharacterized protein dnm_085770 [Desulfonema magnum]|uniref:Uncharacterized protein n=1 Tax=Desulfonema magnum TaxID=45655 RepID=A0A975BW64_9BACT|nr:Uncharacterized protein dnm_085770 [Desulfonema magnum]